MAGDPSLDATADAVRTLEKCGADIIELGVPFSDPLADGPVIQRAAERALNVGVSLRDVIALVGELRKSSRIPIVLMTYYNPVFKLGEEEFMRSASEAGVDLSIMRGRTRLTRYFCLRPHRLPRDGKLW
jgi:tryptophan synthase alpha chain